MGKSIIHDYKFNFIDLIEFKQGSQLTLEIIHANGDSNKIKLNHTYNRQQIEWFKSGSALNLLRKQTN